MSAKKHTQMKALKNKVIVRSISNDGVLKDKVSGLYMVTLFNPGRFDELNFGTVVGISDDEEEIRVGDKVMVHHNAFHENAGNQIDVKDNIYNLDREFGIYCYIRDEKIHMISDFVFMEPVEADKKHTPAGIYLPFLKGPKQGVIRHMGKNIPDTEGIGIGDTVVYTKAADYEMEVEGKLMYRMKQSRILAKVG